jgi:hypothetical protein
MTKKDTMQIAWIPQKFAIKGKFLKLKMSGGWNNGWIVESVGKPMDGGYVLDHRSDYKKQRKASDI